MGLKWYGAQRLAELKNATARGLLAAAVTLQSEEKARVNVSNQQGKAPSSPGEYPRKRTGFGQAGIVYEPTTVAGVAQGMRVRVGYLRNAFYLGYLGVKRKRKWLVDTVKSIRATLATVATGGKP